MGETFIIQTENLQLSQLDFLVRLLVATGIGFVIGLEREHASQTEKEEIFAGVRTFVFVVLFGFLTTFLSALFSFWILVVGLFGVIVMVAVSYWVSAHQGQIGGTSEFVALLAYLLGSATLLGYVESSLALMVIVLVFLSIKVELHRLIGRITQDELYAFIRFVVLALLIFPFLPDASYGPYQVINPREIGWVILLTSGFGFLGYVLMKFWSSNKGILLTGLVGGLISSTVVTWVFSKKSKEVPELSVSCAVAILAASTIMVIRVFIWVYLFNQQLLPDLILPLGLVFLVGLGVSIFYFRDQQHSSQLNSTIPLGKPLNVREAVVFGLIYAVILFSVSYANAVFGARGIFASSAIAALADIDAITISVSKLAGDSISQISAQNAILLATLCNTIVKIAIALWFGSNDLRKHIWIGYGLIFIAGLVGFLILNI